MLKIRRGFFETNSSSTHSMVMIGNKERELLSNGAMIDCCGDIMSYEEIKKYFDEWVEERKDYIDEVIASGIKNEDTDRDYSQYTEEENLWWIYTTQYERYYKNADDWAYSSANEYLEHSSRNYVTENGEHIECEIVFGYDG